MVVVVLMGTKVWRVGDECAEGEGANDVDVGRKRKDDEEVDEGATELFDVQDEDDNNACLFVFPFGTTCDVGSSSCSCSSSCEAVSDAEDDIRQSYIEQNSP